MKWASRILAIVLTLASFTLAVTGVAEAACCGSGDYSCCGCWCNANPDGCSSGSCPPPV